MTKYLFLILCLIPSMALADVDVTALPDIGAPTTASDGIVTYDTDYTAITVINYVRAGFDRAAVSYQYQAHRSLGSIPALH